MRRMICPLLRMALAMVVMVYSIFCESFGRVVVKRPALGAAGMGAGAAGPPGRAAAAMSAWVAVSATVGVSSSLRVSRADMAAWYGVCVFMAGVCV